MSGLWCVGSHRGGGESHMGLNLGTALPFGWGCGHLPLVGGVGVSGVCLWRWFTVLYLEESCRENARMCPKSKFTHRLNFTLFITCSVYNVVCAPEIGGRKVGPCDTSPRQADLRLERR